MYTPTHNQHDGGFTQRSARGGTYKYTPNHNQPAEVCIHQPTISMRRYIYIYIKPTISMMVALLNDRPEKVCINIHQTTISANLNDSSPWLVSFYSYVFIVLNVSSAKPVILLNYLSISISHCMGRHMTITRRTL